MGKKLYVGVDLGGTSMRAGVLDKKGNLLSMEKRKTHPELGAAGVLERLVKTIGNAAQGAGVKLKDIDGIGIGVPGPIDSAKGIVRVAVNLGKDWTNYPLAKKLETELHIPVYLDND